jgi:5-methylcytosine-specific restriction enzyme subunit McrC
MNNKHQNKCETRCTISEFGLIGTDDFVENCNAFKSGKVKPEVYEELEAFAKTDYGKDVFTFSSNGRYLQAKSYVGTIQTKSGFSIEILPKIYSNDNDEKNLNRSKEIFLELLRLLYKLPKFKHIKKANFQIDKMPLLEIFIAMFLNELALILKKGIKSDYIANQENLYFLKGKLLINQHLKENYIHKEKFFVEHDEYTPNRVENKLLKSTLRYLLKLSSSYENIRLLRMYQEHMYGIDYSLNYDADFRRCKTHVRGMEHYRNALVWAKVFLAKESFSSFSGDTVAFAILYPMEKLFENYVEHYLRERYQKNNAIEIYPQATGMLFVKNLFNVRPDYLIKKGDKVICVADAKWKVMSRELSFSQNDFYQLYAYSQIYSEKNKRIGLRIYYPKSEYLQEKKSFVFFDKTKIKVIPLDMNDVLKDKN